MAARHAFPVVATVPTGLERGAAEECRELLGREATARRGSITCTLEAVDELSMVYSLSYIAVLMSVPVIPTV
jgi:hypothetical protein